MKRKLALQCGDKVTLKIDNKIKLYLITNKQTEKEGEIILNSPYHIFIENLGLLIKPNIKKHSIFISKFSKQKTFFNIEVLEIERKNVWYITLANKLIFWKKK